MANGEQVARLFTALSGVELGHVRLAAADWHDGAKVLRDVAAALAKCSPDIREHFGGETGEAAQKAFDEVHGRVSERAIQMAKAGVAVDDAGDAIFTAQEAAAALEADAPQTPAKEQPAIDETPHQALNREARDGQRASDYAIELDKQESKARAIVTAMEADYDVSTAKLKEIHGDPDPVDDNLPGGGGGPGDGTGGGPPTGDRGQQPGGHVTTTGVVHDPRPPRPEPPEPPVCFPQPPQPPEPPPPPPLPPEPPLPPLPPEPPLPPLPPEPPLPSPGTPPLGAPVQPPGSVTTGATATSPPGLSAGVAGGLSAGAIGGLAGGAVRGALAPRAGGTPARPIGARGRTGAPGALGRRGAAGAPGARGGAEPAGSPAGRGSRGGPGGAGGRAAAGAGAAGGRGRGTKRDRDDDDPKRDLFLDEDGWTDDEGAAPGVID